MSANIYNGYILFTATLGNDISSIMMIFGFANGTDSEIDISPYLMDTGHYEDSYNLYDYLFAKMRVDNNIFGYEKIQKIKLVSICDELLLYKGRNENRESSPLSSNELFDADYTLFQNKEKTKEENKIHLSFF